MKLDFGKIKGVIFDIDGTIIDSMPIWQDVCARYLRSIGIEPEPNLNEIVFTMTIKEGCKYTKEHYNLSKTEQEIEDGIIEMIKQFYYYDAMPKPGAVRLVNEFASQGIPMVLATTGDEDLAMHALERFGIWKCFTKLLTCGSLNTSKREPLVFNVAKGILEETLGSKLAYEDIYVFEDSPTAIRTTKALGFTVVGLADDAAMDDWQEIIHKADVFYYSLNEAFGDVVCPCCRKGLFEKANSYEICDECGWENDDIQRRDPDYEGGANKDSLKEWILKYQGDSKGYSK